MNFTQFATSVRVSSLAITLAWLMLLVLLLPVELNTVFSWNAFLIDSQSPMWPLTLQVLMWLAFFVSFGELIIRWFSMQREREQLARFHLKDVLSPGELITPELMPSITKIKIKQLVDETSLTTFFKRISNQFQSSRNVGDVYNSVTTTLDLKLHDLDLQYSFIRYLAWLIPTLGFVGTVVGIAIALGNAGILEPDDPELLSKVIPMLSSAFYTTLLALIQSALVMYCLQLVQKMEERVITSVANYCIDNIVTELYVED